ncbi:hypothetical protein D3C73_1500010 [compost metagenome]
MPPSGARRNPQVTDQATTDTTTGEKKIVRNPVMPFIRRLRSTARLMAITRFRMRTPALNSRLATTEAEKVGSAKRRE